MRFIWSWRPEEVLCFFFVRCLRCLMRRRLPENENRDQGEEVPWTKGEGAPIAVTSLQHYLDAFRGRGRFIYLVVQFYSFFLRAREEKKKVWVDHQKSTYLP